MQLSQIFISDEPEAPLAPFIEHATRITAHSLRDYPRVQYDLEMLRDVLRAHFDPRVLRAFDKLRGYASKADLGRYCLQYLYGGWYADISIRVIERPRVPEDVEMIVFRDIQANSRTSWACQTCLFYARPRHPILATAIAEVVRNVEEGYYGMTPLCPTATPLFGRAIAAHRPERVVFGDFLELTPNHVKKNGAFVLPDGTIFALYKPTAGGDLESLGARGTNNYNVLWHAREFYTQD